MIDPLLYWLVLILFLDLLFSATRYSLANAREPHLMILREQRPESVDRTMAVLSRPRLLVSLRLAMLLMHFLFPVLVWLLVVRWIAPAASSPFTANLVSIGMLLLAGIFLLMAEYAIEGRVLLNPEVWAIRMASLGALLDFLFTPFSVLLMALSGYGSVQKTGLSVTEDELKVWAEEGQQDGSLEQGERKMIYSIFQFRETLAREIMVPRIDIKAMDITDKVADAIQLLNTSGHSRLPVYENTIDNIVGLLYAKDLLGAHYEEEQLISSIDHILRPPYYVPEAKKVDELLTEMRASHVHLAIVVDEYGGVAGMVTLEDILEEIIGEIQDEYDQAEELLYQEVSPDEFTFQGRIDLDDFNEIMLSKLSKESAETLGGFIYSQMGRVPTGGEKVEVDGVVLVVEQVTGRRIRKVRARRFTPLPEAEVQPSDVDSEP